MIDIFDATRRRKIARHAPLILCLRCVAFVCVCIHVTMYCTLKHRYPLSVPLSASVVCSLFRARTMNNGSSVGKQHKTRHTHTHTPKSHPVRLCGLFLRAHMADACASAFATRQALGSLPAPAVWQQSIIILTVKWVPPLSTRINRKLQCRVIF